MKQLEILHVSRITHLCICVGLLAMLVLASAASSHAQTTAFTYQGQLKDNATPAGGTYDLRFTIYDAGSGGNIVGTPRTNAPVNVTNGLFTVSLDFGGGVFNGTARWLELAVRTNGSAGAYTVLTPRQPLTAAPYALYATNAGSASTASSVAPSSVTAAGIASGQVVKSLNGLTDVVSLTQGANVTINTVSNGLQISAPAGGLALPYSGSVSTSAAAFSISNSLNGNFAWLARDVGLYGSSLNAGVSGQYGTAGNYALLGTSGSGAFGVHVASGNYGQLGTALFGVYAYGAPDRYGVGADADGPTSQAMRGRHTSTGNLGLIGTADEGVRGVHNSSGNYGQLGTTAAGVAGASSTTTGAGVKGIHTPSGVYGELGHAYQAFDIQTVAGVYGSSGGSSGFAGLFDGNVQVNGSQTICVLTITGGCDLSEPFQISGQDIPKGALVTIDKSHPGQLKLSNQAYDKRVAGIVSGANGVKPGISLHQEGAIEGGQNVALSGRVYALADASDDPIDPGDLLTTSPTPGHCMKATDPAKAQGAIIGKAMSTLKDGKGMVLVLVSLQ